MTLESRILDAALAGKLKKLFVFAAVCAALLLCARLASTDEMIKDRVKCYTTWDATYFYLGFKVDCPDVQSTHSTPNAEVTGDDSIEFFIETDNEHAEEITPSCFSMVVSAAGGAQFRAGSEAGALEPTPVFTFKYGSAVQGTANNGDDIDMGYSIEMAIPWSVMKTTVPTTGDMMSFNVLVHRHGENDASFISLSPRVKTQQDALNPAKWVNIVFAAHSFGVATASVEKVLSAKYVVRSPLVDGVVGDREWHRNTSFAIDLPMPEGFVYEAKYPIQRTLFTHYFYWYQADRRKAAPYSHISGSDGVIQLQNFPAKNCGPWFSYDRVQWHKEELSDIIASGIDVVLPIYWGNKASTEGFAAKGLDCMVSALAELRAEGKPYPLVAMFFDTTAMELAYGEKPDLKNEEVQRTFYSMIKDFFERVPAEFRALAPADKPRAGQPANIVFLYSPGFFSDFDSSFVRYCDERFEKDFGYPLVWIASTGFRAKAQGFDGFSNYGTGLGLHYDDTGRIQVGAVGAGFDNSAVSAQGKARIRSRMGGETYGEDWAAIIEKNPQWVVCDGWNELHEASDLCASRQYDRKYIDATRSNVTRFLGNRDFDAQYLQCSVPKVVPAKHIAQAQIAVRNIGNSPWRASDGYALAYRWYRSGRYYGESKVRRRLERDVLPGDTTSVIIGIATVNARGDEMPEGDCELRFELIRLSDNKWFSALGDQPLMVPILIGEPAQWDATYLNCTAPVMMAANQNYAVRLRVRNDGTQLWKKGATKLGCKLYKVSNYTHDNPVDLSEEVPIRQVRALLAEDCKPGHIAEFMLDFKLVDPDNKPLPSWKQNDPWSYQLRFDIFNGEDWLSELGVRTLDRIVDIYDTDYGPRIVDCDIPAKLIAGQKVQVKVILRNSGVHVWSRKRTKLGYHWYHLDGTEMDWDGAATPIKADQHPGMPTIVTAEVKAPNYDGQYVLVWDVIFDDKWLSLEPISRGGDILPVFVEVTNGKLAFADLGELYDICATSPDTDRTAGDFDGAGSSFPAEFMPPDASVSGEASHIYPSGYNWRHDDVPEGRISFYYPDKVPGTKNAVACSGQKVDIEDSSYLALHVLGASTNGNASGELSLNYSGGAQSRTISMSDWGTAPANGEKVGCVVRHRHSHGGDDNSKYCYLHHYTIPLDPTKTLTDIKLPANADMKVVAITLERTAVRPAL